MGQVNAQWVQRLQSPLAWKVVLPLLAAALAALVAFISPPQLRQFEDSLDDRVWRQVADDRPERRVVIVDIDEVSLAERGPWPWPRDLQAQLMHQIANLGARQQIWDVVFSTAGSGRDEAANRRLVSAIQQHKPVIAQIFGIGGPRGEAGASVQIGQPAGGLESSHCGAPFTAASGFLANDAPLAQVASAVGHITPQWSEDGILRKQPAFICHDGRAYPALALSAAAQLLGNGNWELSTGGPFAASAYSLSLVPATAAQPLGAMPKSGTTSPHAPLLSVPVDAQGNLTLAWTRDARSWLSISAADILAGRVPRGLLDGALVVVGGSAFMVNDRITTPLQANTAGVVAHAQLLVNLLDQNALAESRNPVWAASVLGLLAGSGLLVTPWAWRRLRARSSGAGGAGGASGANAVWLPVVALTAAPVLWTIHLTALLGFGWRLGWFAPATGVALSGLLAGIVAHWHSRREGERLYGHLSSYLPPPVAKILAQQQRSGAIEVANRNVVVLVADIRNFSAYCESRPPEEAAAVLHAFYSTANGVINRYGGTLEALQGDSIMAAWTGEFSNNRALDRAPTEQAVSAALELMTAMTATLPDPAPAGLEALALGIGIEAGPAIAGSIGPEERRTHLVMGRTTTIANRLVEMTAELAHPILLGEGFAAQSGGQHRGRAFRSLGTFMLEGLRVPHHVYACVNHHPSLLATSELEARLPSVPSADIQNHGTHTPHLH